MSTIPGASGVPVTLTSQTAAQQAIAVISSAANVTPVTVTGGSSAPTVAGTGELVVNAGANPVSVNVNTVPNFRFVVIGDSNAPVSVTNAAVLNQVVLLGADLTGSAARAAMTYNTAGGSGLIVGGAGNKTISTGAGTNFGIYTGPGSDTISMASSPAAGRSTISSGGGASAIALGAAPTEVQSAGSDTIAVGAGAVTVQAIGSAAVSVVGSTGSRTVVNNAGVSTVYGGTGSATVSGGAGGGQFYGGSAGNNLLIGGSGGSYLTGGGTGDVLIATSTTSGQVLLAGAGNETLLGSLSTANNVFEAGPGSNLVVAGSGNDTLYAGSGSATMTGGAGANVFMFNSLVGRGGHVTITDFKQNTDLVELRNYGDQPATLVAAAAHPTATSTQVTLSDGTSITFLGLSAINTATFG